jgi:hypothetical protein
MRKYVAIGLLLIMSVTANADHRWGPMVSYWDAGDWGDGTSGGVMFSFEVVPDVNFEFRATYFDLSGTSQGFETSVEAEPLEFGFCKMSKIGGIETSIGIGIGYYMTDAHVYVSPTQKVTAQIGDELGFYANAGLEIPISVDTTDTVTTKVALMLEVIYRAVPVNDVDILNEGLTYRLSDSMDGFGANVGIMLHW